MAKGHRSQIKRERNAQKDTRPSAKLSYARVSVQKACFVLDAIRGKDVTTALGILTYNPRYASSLIKKLLESAIANAENNYPEKNYKLENLGTPGNENGKYQYTVYISKSDGNGILSITGSAFLDDGTSNGGQISGLAVCNGVEMGSRLGGYGDKRLELREDDRMYIVDSADDLNPATRDACEFSPALIVDGENVAGNSTWNSPNPRAVLGQSDRLETMMIVVEGRLLDSLGCGVKAVADKLEQYGCVQAMNLDGGTSAIMYYKGKNVTRCSNTELPNGRNMPTAWVYGEKAE